MQDKLPHIAENNIKFDENTRSLSILLVSDIHNGWKQLDHLKAWYDKNPQKFDYVFGLGDFDVIRPKPGDAINEQNNNYTDITKILTILEYFSAPIIYIPGNHDPIGLFHEDRILTANSINAQNKSLLIADGLQVVGFGGSLHGYTEKDMKFEILLDAYPYNNEEEYGKDLHPVVEKYCNEDVQTLLLTHIGPFYSSTGIIYSERKGCNLWFGSKELEKVLKTPKLNILADLHGHVHPSVGRTNMGNVQIINPGSVFEKSFGVISLERLKSNNKWVVKKSEFIYLDAFEY